MRFTPTSEGKFALGTDKMSRRAEYARLLRMHFDRHGGTLRQVADQLGISAEAFRQNKDGTTVPASRAKVRRQDEVLNTGGALERALYGESDAPPPDTNQMMRVLDELADLRRRVAELEQSGP